jgi:hypothetical protein
MRTYQVPVGVYVTADNAEEAREFVESALNGIDDWNDLVSPADLEYSPCFIHIVTIGNQDEVTDEGPPVLI